MPSIRFSILTRLTLVAFFASLPACTPNQRILESANSNVEAGNVTNVSANKERPANSVEDDIQNMRNADFDFIFLFRRKDGAPMDADDKKFFNQYTPTETNRRVISDQGRAVIIGTNTPWEPGNFKKFTGRFNLEDYSKPESEIMNSNVDAKRGERAAKPTR